MVSHLEVYYYLVINTTYSKMTTHFPPQLLIHKHKQVFNRRSLTSSMARMSSGSRDYYLGEASMEAEAREMSRLTVKAADMSCRTAVAAQRSRRTA